MWHAVLFLAPVTTVGTVVLGMSLGGWWSFLTVGWLFVGLAVIDQAVGLDLSDPPAQTARDRTFFRLAVWAWVPVQFSLLAWSFWVVDTWTLSLVEWAGLIGAVGSITGAGGITVAHELMHRKSRFERALAELLMATCSYTHFCIEHVHGHHRRVGTRDDPATARLGETFYSFWVRSVFGGVASAWHLEAARLKRRGKAVFGPSNRMLRYAAELVLIYAVLWALFGWKGVGFFAAQGIFGFTLLEIINYLEHYGLTRREVAPGRFEPVKPHHSWNTSRRITNMYLINLGRHSDHHHQPGRRYQDLRHIADAPQLPMGYPAMVGLALVPLLWHWLMDPRVEEWRRTYQADEPVAA